MEINAIVSLLLSHQFAEARSLWRSIKGENKHPAMKGIGVYFHLKDKKYEEIVTYPTVTGDLKMRNKHVGVNFDDRDIPAKSLPKEKIVDGKKRDL